MSILALLEAIRCAIVTAFVGLVPVEFGVEAGAGIESVLRGATGAKLNLAMDTLVQLECPTAIARA